MKPCGKSIPPVVGNSEQSCEPNAPHTSHQCPFLCIKSIWEASLMSGKVQPFVFVGVICLLKYGNIVRTAVPEISIFVSVQRIYFYTDVFKILSPYFARLTNIFHIGHLSTLTCQYEYFLQS